MNYFELFQIAENLIIDEAALQQQFYTLCKKYHPDVNTNAFDAHISIEMINVAYNVLKNFMLRLEYILKFNKVIESNTENAIPNDFLIEIFELNEQIDTLQNNANNPTLKTEIVSTIFLIRKRLQNQINNIVYPQNTTKYNVEELDILKNIYLKSKYLEKLEKRV